MKILQKLLQNLPGDTSSGELLKGSFWGMLLKVAGMLISYGFVLYVTRFLGAEAMGVFALCQSVLVFTMEIGRFGLNTTLLRLVAELTVQNQKGRIKDVYVRSLFILLPASILLTGIIYFFSDTIAVVFFDKKYLSEHFRTIALAILPFVLLMVNVECLRGLKQIRSFFFFKGIAPFALTILIMLLFIGDNYVGIPVISYTVAVSVVSLIAMVLWLRKSEFFKVKKEKGINYKAMVNISGPIFVSNFMFVIMDWMGTLILGAFHPEETVGAYNVAVRVANLTTLTLIAINSISAPKFAEDFKRSPEKLKKTIQQSTKMIFWSTLPILIGIMVFPSFILNIFGEEFKVAIYGLLILSVGKFVNAACGSVMYILQMTGRQKAGQKFIILAALINVLLCFWLIPQWGIEGAAIASTVSAVTWNLLAVFYIKKELGIYTFSMTHLFKF